MYARKITGDIRERRHRPNISTAGRQPFYAYARESCLSHVTECTASGTNRRNTIRIRGFAPPILDSCVGTPTVSDTATVANFSGKSDFLRAFQVLEPAKMPSLRSQTRVARNDLERRERSAHARMRKPASSADRMKKGARELRC